MRLEQLLNFKRVADERSYTRAAEKCFLTQPAIYNQIRQLETECQGKLFYVSGKEVLLTAEGKALYQFAEDIALANDRYLMQRRSRAERRANRVRIGALAYFGIIAEAAEQLRAEDSSITVDLHSCRPDEAIELIRAEELDFGLCGPAFMTDDLVFEHCTDYDLTLVAPTDHPLAGREIDFEELEPFPVVGFSVGSVRVALEQWLAADLSRKVRYAAQGDTSLAVKTLSEAMGVPAFMVRQAVEDDLTRGNLAEVRIRGFDASYPVYLIYLEESALGSAAARFLRVVRAIGCSRRHRGRFVVAE
ncbi:MAG: LysR family transcriptional regulator [Dehalococcoidia bacterium]|nr:LysR family transcriptional regulator [Dehalococcoidia bacterium]